MLKDILLDRLVCKEGMETSWFGWWTRVCEIAAKMTKKQCELFCWLFNVCMHLVWSRIKLLDEAILFNIAPNIKEWSYDVSMTTREDFLFFVKNHFIPKSSNIVIYYLLSVFVVTARRQTEKDCVICKYLVVLVW